MKNVSLVCSLSLDPVLCVVQNMESSGIWRNISDERVFVLLRTEDCPTKRRMYLLRCVIKERTQKKVSYITNSLSRKVRLSTPTEKSNDLLYHESSTHKKTV